MMWLFGVLFGASFNFAPQGDIPPVPADLHKRSPNSSLVAIYSVSGTYTEVYCDESSTFVSGYHAGCFATGDLTYNFATGCGCLYECSLSKSWTDLYFLEGWTTCTSSSYCVTDIIVNDPRATSSYMLVGCQQRSGLSAARTTKHLLACIEA
ncbi:uncharacterized protein BDR25DRAFT_44602 [Lindgomyces ingoldianus]|uniref:Uncharacterized protein n=1 Tax=Lindgomyces ingoldianus TaxID=673940 RepID=A0ACB6RER9_9PLEO|nr:uncharacterized protein BDR25DRAFT_44602 [Lindgomyces ingoldianus]KAF2477248.1 hypothetical protein BDR25DRAFT_44602 [Lindgomyces ingoldianus]